MAGTTSHYGFPYDTGTDQVPTFPTRLKNLADAIDTQLFNGLAAKANYKFQASAPSGPAAGDLWIDSDDNKAYVWTGSAWVNFSSVGRATYSATTGSPTITTVSGKTCIKWTGSGSITIGGNGGLVEALIDGGGGAGGFRTAGGGGGGGVLYSTSLYLPAGTHTVTVGAGGAARGSAPGNNGNTSRVGSYTAPGGGGGGATAVVGSNGGNGGGGGAASAAGGAGWDFGYSGGTASTTLGGGGGGGGAAGVAGGSGGTGGAGYTSAITGSSVVYAGGGGGGIFGGTAGAGGTGGGGAGSTSNTTATAGTANTGGGGGGGGFSADPGGPGGAGGSGVVILLIG